MTGTKKDRIPSKTKIIKRTKKYMQELGTYKEQFAQAIDVYADMVYQYNVLSNEFASQGYKCSIDTERGGEKKNPILVTLENLRKDIGTYSDRLMLTAKSYSDDLKKPKEEKSAFSIFLENHKK